MSVVQDSFNEDEEYYVSAPFGVHICCNCNEKIEGPYDYLAGQYYCEECYE